MELLLRDDAPMKEACPVFTFTTRTVGKAFDYVDEGKILEVARKLSRQTRTSIPGTTS
jgi:hypothetical protein